MKTLIAIKDIRKGDLIRWEHADDETAHEFRAATDGWEWPDSQKGQHFLLDRPKPRVEITYPTLGWIRTEHAEPHLGTWNTYEHRGVMYTIQPEREFPAVAVVSFCPAVAVPRDALDALHRSHAKAAEVRDSRVALAESREGVRDFLRAIDEAPR